MVMTDTSSSAHGSFPLLGCKCSARAARSPDRGCGTLHTTTPVRRPDLAIYSQAEALARGNAPSWDSPDISTNLWGPFRLREEALIKIRNLSASVPAINALVHFAVSPFGIGTRAERRLSRTVNVSPGREVELSFPFDQATRAGDPRIGVHVLIEHPHDELAINNEGSQVHDGGYTTESGKDFTVSIPVLNDSTMPREIRLSIMPTDLLASISPTAHLFAPHEQIVATLHIQVPTFLSGAPDLVVQRAVTVVGRLSTGELVGGATRLVWIDD
jgi:hypothetical protein